MCKHSHAREIGKATNTFSFKKFTITSFCSSFTLLYPRFLTEAAITAFTSSVVNYFDIFYPAITWYAIIA